MTTREPPRASAREIRFGLVNGTFPDDANQEKLAGSWRQKCPNGTVPGIQDSCIIIIYQSLIKMAQALLMVNRRPLGRADGGGSG